MSCSTRSSTLADATLDRENKWIYTAPHLNGCFLTPWHFLYPTSMHVAERASTYHTALFNITCILHIPMIPAHISALLFTNIKAPRNPQLFSIHRLSPHSPQITFHSIFPHQQSLCNSPPSPSSPSASSQAPTRKPAVLSSAETRLHARLSVRIWAALVSIAGGRLCCFCSVRAR
jgi:hypothetical protein